MGMDSNNYERYEEIYKCYRDTYDLPLIKTNFFQDDYRAMNYCEDRDFVALVVPFGEPSGDLANKIVVQNNLVSYTKMYSDLIGGRAHADKDFLCSAIEIAKKKANLKSLEEFTPIALIENAFTYEKNNSLIMELFLWQEYPKGGVWVKMWFLNPLMKKYILQIRIIKFYLSWQRNM